MKNYSARKTSLILSQVAIVMISVMNHFSKGFILSSGDIRQAINFGNIFHSLNYVWDSQGQGAFQTIFSSSPYYRLINSIGTTFNLSSSQYPSIFILVFLLGSFWSFYFAGKIYKKEAADSFYLVLFSFLYAVNSFVMCSFTAAWGYTQFLSLYIIFPLLLVLIKKFVETGEKKSLWVLGIFFVLSNIPNANLSFFISFNLVAIVLIILVKFFYGLPFGILIKRAFWIFLLEFAAVLWSVLPQVSEMLKISQSLETGSSFWDLKSWIIWQAAPLNDVFTFTDGFFGRFSHYWWGAIFGFIFIFLLVWFLYRLKLKSKDFLIFILLVLFVFFLENKGKGWLNQSTTIAIFNNTVLGSLRSVLKTSVLVPFLVLFSLFIVFANDLIRRKKVYYVLLLLSLVSVIPFFLGNIVEKYSKASNTGQSSTSVVKIPDEYFQLSSELNSDKKDGKILSMPYNVMSSISWVNFPKWGVAGVDPTIQFFNNSTVQMNSPESFGIWNWGEAWNEDKDGSWLPQFSGLLNIDYMIYHKDVDKSFLAATQDKIKKLEIDGDIKKIKENDFFILYKISDNFNLSHLYVPQKTVASNLNVDQIPYLLQKSFPNDGAFYLQKQNEDKTEYLNFGNDPQRNVSPILEYKKINPVKYRVVVHGAKGIFPLVFSETYHDGWKSYLTNLETKSQSSKAELLGQVNSTYKILEGSDEDQASKGELIDFVNKGLISSLGDGTDKLQNHYSWENNKQTVDHTEKFAVGFVSKNIKGTIQNDNLKNGSIAETWFKTTIDNNDNHLTANGYANSWIYDADNICNNSTKCKKNSDGTYDFELVLEFWPQRLFYLGGTITLITLLICIYGLFTSRRVVFRGRNE